MRASMLIAALALLGAPALAQEADTQLQAAGQPTATIETAQGNIVIALDREHAPVSVDNFMAYAREGHFDGTVFYRVAPGFVIQAGSYDAQGNMKPVHDPIPLEANNGLKNVKGAVAMARGDEPASATAEFFIDLSDLPALDHSPDDPGNTTGYAVFGHVVSGMDVVDKIASAPLGGTGPFPDAAPLEPVTIQKVVVNGASGAPANCAAQRCGKARTAGAVQSVHLTCRYRQAAQRCFVPSNT